MDDEMRQRLVSLVRATHRGGVTVADERAGAGAARRAATGPSAAAKASRRGLRGRNRRSRAVARAIRPETRFGKNRVSPRDGRMALAGRARARSRRGARATATTLQTPSPRSRASRARLAGRRRGPVARHGAGRDVPSARGPANPKHALAMRPGPARRLERATRGRRGDGDFGNWRRARTILCNPDYYVTRCTCAADRGTPDGTTGVFGHHRPLASKRQTRIPTKNVRTHSSESRLKLGGLKKPSMPAYFGPDFVNWVFR